MHDLTMAGPLFRRSRDYGLAVLLVLLTVAPAWASSLPLAQRSYSIDFGTQSLRPTLLVSESTPLVSKQQTLPMVVCGTACNDPAARYHYEETWVVDRNTLDTLRSNQVSQAGNKQPSWVFAPGRSGAEWGPSGLLVMIRPWAGGASVTPVLNCSPGKTEAGELSCTHPVRPGNSADAVALEVGLLVVSRQVTPGHINAINRPLLQRRITFYREAEEGNEPVAEYQDNFSVRGRTQTASCSVDAGELNFYLPARSVDSVPLFAVAAPPPADATHKTLTFTCSGIQALAMAFTPLSGTLGGDSVLQATTMSDGQRLTNLGFQFWLHSDQWAEQQDQPVSWSGSPRTLLAAGQTLGLPAAGSYGTEVRVTLKVAYARTGPAELPVGPIVARGLYTATYE